MVTLYLEAVTWGLGIGSGLLAPLIVYGITKECLDWAAGHRTASRTAAQADKDAIAELKLRNELMIRAVEQMVRVADAAEAVAHQSDEFQRFLLKHAPEE